MSKKLITLIRHLLHVLLSNYWSYTFVFIIKEIYFWKMRLDQPFGGQACILYILSRYLLERRNLRTFQWFFWNHKGNLSIKISPLYLSPTGFLVLSKWIMPVSQYKHCHNENTDVTINVALNTTDGIDGIQLQFILQPPPRHLSKYVSPTIALQSYCHNENTRLHSCKQTINIGGCHPSPRKTLAQLMFPKT